MLFEEISGIFQLAFSPRRPTFPICKTLTFSFVREPLKRTESNMAASNTGWLLRKVLTEARAPEWSHQRLVSESTLHSSADFSRERTGNRISYRRDSVTKDTARA